MQLLQIRNALDVEDALALQLALERAIGINYGLVVIGTVVHAAIATRQRNSIKLAAFLVRDALPLVQLIAGNALIHTAPIPTVIATERAVLRRAALNAAVLAAIPFGIAAIPTAAPGTLFSSGRLYAHLGRLRVPAMPCVIVANRIIG